MSARARGVLDLVQRAFARDPLEQSTAERLARTAVAVGLLWVAIYWALA
jgi:hypothetical protein